MPLKKAATKPAARATSATKKKTAASTTTKGAAATKSVAQGRSATATRTTAKNTAKTKAPTTRKTPKTEDTNDTKDARNAPAQPTRKRRAEAGDESEARQSVKRARVAKPVATKQKPKVVINNAPSTKLNVYVCGEGSSGELGLGIGKNVIDVKRPRLNPHLPSDTVGVVQVAVGGMHCVALTHDNNILTWGVNDQGALGRDTTWDGGYKDMDKVDSDSDSDSEDSPDLNPHESTPTAIPSSVFPESTVFVEVAAGDSSSFALTDDGQVYGWGTFRVSMHVTNFKALS